MAVTISNVGARHIWSNNGEYESSIWQSPYINTGFYNSSYTYVSELRFRLDKPCSSIAISFNGAKDDGVGTMYLVVSDKELDEELLDQIYTSGGVADAKSVYISYSSYFGKNMGELTIEGAFPANAELYIYGYRPAATSYNVIKLYGLYDSSHYTKVTAATEAEYYAVSYDPGAHGSGEVTGNTKVEGFPLTLEGAIFARTGYTQTGWSATDGGEKVYELSGSYTANEAVTLYPYWTANSYTIKLDPHGGKFASGGKDEVTLEEKLCFDGTNLNSLADYAARKNGCGFMGWYAADGTRVYDAKGACVRETPYWDAEGRYIYPGDLSLYARWKAGVVLWALFHIVTKGKVTGGHWAVRTGSTLTLYRAYFAAMNGNILEVG